MADLENINNSLLPIHRGEKWVGRWCRDWTRTDKTINTEVLGVIEDRVDYLIERWQINVHEPRRISDILNRVAYKYNGIIYEENGIMMEIDFFNEDLEENEEPYLFGMGNSKVFNQYIFDNYPELLI